MTERSAFNEVDQEDGTVVSDVSGDTRAGFLRKGAIGGGALVAGGALFAALPGTAKADTATDIRVLNYALTLEHLEATFYTQGLQQLTEKKILNARAGRIGGRYRTGIYEYLQLIRDHEIIHVKALTSVIQGLGGTPVPPCTYNFETTAFTSAAQFLSVAQALENTGVMAYDGAIHLLSGSTSYGTYPIDLLTVGATIATVEARHAAYLNLVNGDSPFPAAFDTPKLPSEICAIAGQFIVSCPYPLASVCTP